MRWLAILVTCVVVLRAAAAAPVVLPDGMTLPAGFALVDKQTKTFDYFHVEVGYLQGGVMRHEDKAGKTWLIYAKLATPNKSGDDTAATIRAWVKAAGWELLTQNQPIVAKRDAKGKEQWLHATMSSGEASITVVEVSPPPHVLALAPPAKVVEKVGDAEDFPYLGTYPGAKLVKSTLDNGRHFDVTASGAKSEQLAGPPVMVKEYSLPVELSAFERMVVYRDALAKAGWSIIRAQNGSDSLVVAHYGKDGRDLFAYLHDGTFQVADVGAQNDAKQLAAALGKDGHVAIYGIYFDVDKDVLKPESEIALAHIVELLKLDPKLALEVQGHTDSTGGADHNRTLSEARAASVVKWLVAHGVADKRLVPKGYGDTVPVGDNKTPEGRAKNRRVELKKR